MEYKQSIDTVQRVYNSVCCQCLVSVCISTGLHVTCVHSPVHTVDCCRLNFHQNVTELTQTLGCKLRNKHNHSTYVRTVCYTLRTVRCTKYVRIPLQHIRYNNGSYVRRVHQLRRIQSSSYVGTEVHTWYKSDILSHTRCTCHGQQNKTHWNAVIEANSCVSDEQDKETIISKIHSLAFTIQPEGVCPLQYRMRGRMLMHESLLSTVTLYLYKPIPLTILILYCS